MRGGRESSVQTCTLKIAFSFCCSLLLVGKKRDQSKRIQSHSQYAFEPFLVAHIRSPSFKNSCLPRIFCNVKEKSACFTTFYFTHPK